MALVARWPCSGIGVPAALIASAVAPVGVTRATGGGRVAGFAASRGAGAGYGVPVAGVGTAMPYCVRFAGGAAGGVG